jgi:hypothetical protein
VSIVSMRALPCASVRIGSCQPSQERASTPMSCSAIASRPPSPARPTRRPRRIRAASCSRGWPPAETDELIGLARHGGDHHGHLVAGVDLAFDARATLRIRSIPAIEVPPNFITMRAIFAAVSV